MAKRCEVCNRLYSDKHLSCPYCKAPAAEGGQEEDVFAAVWADEDPVPAQSSSVSLGGPDQPHGPPDPSDIIAIQDSEVDLGDDAPVEAQAISPSEEALLAWVSDSGDAMHAHKEPTPPEEAPEEVLEISEEAESLAEEGGELEVVDEAPEDLMDLVEAEEVDPEEAALAGGSESPAVEGEGSAVDLLAAHEVPDELIVVDEAEAVEAAGTEEAPASQDVPEAPAARVPVPSAPEAPPAAPRVRIPPVTRLSSRTPAATQLAREDAWEGPSSGLGGLAGFGRGPANAPTTAVPPPGEASAKVEGTPAQAPEEVPPLARRAAEPTKMAPKSPPPTMLAPKSAPPTTLAARSPASTMLAPPGEGEAPASAEEGAGPAGTGAGQPPSLVPAAGRSDAGTPGFPNLSLDSAEMEDEVLDTALDEEDNEVVEAQAASGAGLEHAGPASGDALEVTEEAEEVVDADAAELVEQEAEAGEPSALTEPSGTGLSGVSLEDAQEVEEEAAPEDEGEEIDLLGAGRGPAGNSSALGLSGFQLEEFAEEEPEEVLEVVEEASGQGLSGIDVAEAAGLSGLDLAEAEEAAQAEEVQEAAAQDEFDLGALDLPGQPPAVRTGSTSGRSGLDDMGEDLLVEGESAIDLGNERPSGVDLIAEALESGVDLGRAPTQKSKPPAQKPRVSELDLGQGPTSPSPIESSAVDLGASGPEFDIPSMEPPVSSKAYADEGLDSGRMVVESADDPLAVEEEAAEAEEVAEAAEAEEATEAEEAVEAEEEAVEVDEEALVGDSGTALDEAAADDLLAEAGDEAAEEVAADTLFGGDDEEAAAVEEEAEAEDEAFAEEAAEEEETVAAGRGKKAKPARGRKAPALDEEEGPAPKPFKPKYGRRWAGGVLVGLLLAVGGAAGVWYFAPELLEEIPRSPNAPQKTEALPQGQQRAAPIQVAHLHFDKGDFQQALDALKDAKSAEELSVRGEARWLKYLKEQKAKNAPLDPEAEEVKQAKKDLEAAKNDLLQTQLVGTLGAQAVAGELTDLKKSERAIREALGKDKAVPEEDLKNLPDAVTKLVTAKQDEEAKLAAVAKALVDSKQLDDPEKFDPKNLEPLLKDLVEAKQTAAAVADLLKVKPELAPKEVKKLKEARDDVEAKLEQVDKQLQDAKVADGGAKGVQQLVGSRDKLEKEKSELNDALTQTLKALSDGAPLPEGADAKKEVVQNALAMRDKARSPLVSAVTSVVAPLGGVGAGAGAMVKDALDRAGVEAQLRFYQAREPLIEPPGQKIDTWLTLFQDRDRKTGREVEAAVKDAGWVTSKDAGAGAEARAKAVYLEGLIARNQGKFAEARKHLSQAVKEAEGLKASADWPAQAGLALKELSEASAYYLPRAEKLYAEGQFKEALQELNTGLEAIPDDGGLLALRSLVRLDQAEQGKLTKEVQQEVRADAEAAKKAPNSAAAGYYALGRLEEELGQLGKAEQNFRMALKSATTADEQSRARIALARVLQRDRPAANDAGPQPKQGMGPDKTGRAPGPEEQAPPALAADPLPALLVLAVTGLQQLPEEDEDPEAAARLNESIELARELINSANPKTKGQGYLLLGQAHTKQGKRTEGLQEFVKGLTLLYPGVPTRELNKLVDEHPAFQQPDVQSQPNPVLAESHYGKGLYYYWSREYPQAEQQFKKAVSYYKQDPRYQYYLGLSRLAQETRLKREAAYFDFEQGARLEALNPNSSIEVNASLERIQGPLRQYLNRFRQKAISGVD